MSELARGFGAGGASLVLERSAWRAALVGLVAVLLSGCLLGGPSRVDRMRESLVGFPARDLRACIGVPMDVEVAGDTEYLLYRWIETSEGSDDPFLSSRERRVGRGPDLDDARRRADAVRGRPRLGDQVGFCELRFEIQEGRVREVKVDSRQPSGLRDDLACMSKTRGCLRPEE